MNEIRSGLEKCKSAFEAMCRGLDSGLSITPNSELHLSIKRVLENWSSFPDTTDLGHACQAPALLVKLEEQGSRQEILIKALEFYGFETASEMGKVARRALNEFFEFKTEGKPHEQG